MAISRIGQATAQSSTITIPGTYAAGDLIIVVAARANLTAPTVPAGWVTLSTAGISGISLVVACKHAQSSSESAPSFTNAQILNCEVLRASSGFLFPMTSSPNGGTSATINYAALANNRPGVLANWYIAAAAQTNTANSLETAPSGMTNVNFDSVTGLKAVLHDTNADQLSNWASTNVGPLTNSAAYRSAVFQIAEMTYTFPSGGGFRPVNIRGGADQ